MTRFFDPSGCAGQTHKKPQLPVPETFRNEMHAVFFSSVLLHFLDDIRNRFEDFLSFLFPSLLRSFSAVRTLETVFRDGFSAPLADHT